MGVYTTPSTADRPNIVLLSVDSLRADHCGFLDSPFDLTPTLDALADEGLCFETAISPGPRTPSSMPVIWTGRHVGDDNKGVYDSRQEKQASWQQRQQRIRRHLSRFETVAERLSNRGYETGAVTTNPWTTTDTGFHQGFDEFEAIHGLPADGSTSLLKELLASGSKLPQIPDTEQWLLTWTDSYETIREMRTRLTEPYFLWVFLLDPHQPYLASRSHRAENTSPEMYYANIRYTQGYSPFDALPAHLDSRLSAAYRDAVRSVDGFVDRLRTDLAADDPAFVVHADHGEAFGEHGTRGHRPELYEENLRVPLLAHNVGATGRIADQVTLRHLPAFLCSVADRTPQVDTLRQTPAVASTEETERLAVRTAGYKSISSRPDWDFVRQGPLDELYDLRDDPGETENLVASRQTLRALLERWAGCHRQRLSERKLIGDAARTVRREQM